MILVMMIVGLILGTLFLKFFNQIDFVLFGNSGGYYRTFGLLSVAVCALAGALAGGSYFLDGVFKLNWQVAVVQTLAAILVIAAVSYAVYESCAKIRNISIAFKKVCFMVVACAIGTFVGFVGSVAVVILVILVLLAYIFGAVLSGSMGSRSVYNREADDLNAEREQMRGRDDVSEDEVRDLNSRIDDHNSRSGKNLLG